jgi:hypothetical protein
MKPDRAAILALARHNDALGLCVFARAPQAAITSWWCAPSRSAWASPRIPASGAANGAIAAFLDERGALGALGDRFRVSQGREMGRDAELLLRIDGERQVWVRRALSRRLAGASLAVGKKRRGPEGPFRFPRCGLISSAWPRLSNCGRTCTMTRMVRPGR